MNFINKVLCNLQRVVQHISKKIVPLTGRVVGVPELRYFCPACQQRVWEWRPFRRGIGCGETNFEPSRRLCPLCDSFERTRHFALYIEQKGILDSKPRMLHFAPEKSLEPRFRKRLGERYITTDLYMAKVDSRQDITAMDFKDNFFDFIYCSNVLEHIEADVSAMAELFRILAPGGCAIIQVPIKGKVTYEDPSITDPRARWEHFGQEDHVRYYGEDIGTRLSSAGFAVTPFYMLDVLDIDSEAVEYMNLGKRELIHKCVKPC